MSEIRMQHFTFASVAGVPLPEFVSDHIDRMLEHLRATIGAGGFDEAVALVAATPELSAIPLDEEAIKLLLALAINHAAQQSGAFPAPVLIPRGTEGPLH